MNNPLGHLFPDTGGTACIPTLAIEGIVSLLISIAVNRAMPAVSEASPGSLLRLIIIFLVVLAAIHYSLRILKRPGERAAKLVDIYVANTRAIFKNLENAHTALDKLIRDPDKATELRSLRNRLTTIISDAKNADLDKFSARDATIEEFNAAEKHLLESSERLFREVERQSKEGIDIKAIELCIEEVEGAVRGRIPLTDRLIELFTEGAKDEQREKDKIPDRALTDLTLYLNMLQSKYASNRPDVLHTGDYLPDAGWDCRAGDRRVSARLSNGLGTPLIIEARWHDNSQIPVDLVQNEADAVKKNQYKCLCLVNSSWDKESRDFAARFNHPRLALYLHELSGELLYNPENPDARHYVFWFDREQTRKTLTERALEFSRTHEYFTRQDIARELGLSEEGAKKLLGGLEKKGLVTDVSFRSDKTRRYTKAKE